MGKYDDIINLPHHVSATRPHMSMLERAAQFAPFAALTGYDEMVDETSRFVDAKIEIDEQRKTEIDLNLRRLCADPTLTAVFVVFVPDMLKEGGVYERKVGSIERYDSNRHTVTVNGEEILIESLYDVRSVEGVENS